METNQIEQAAVSPYAAGLNWSADLHTGDGRMDHTHEEFVTMLNALLLTPQTEQLNLYREFLNHTVEHFAQEDRWMLATGFSEDNCHAGQHATILETMRAVETHYVQGDPLGRGFGGMVSPTRGIDGRWLGPAFEICEL
jgi:hemerythrin